MNELTQKEALAFSNSGISDNWSADQIVKFQLFEKNLCFDADRYQKSLSIVFDRPVFIHELVSTPMLLKEYLKIKSEKLRENVIKEIIIERNRDQTTKNQND